MMILRMLLPIIVFYFMVLTGKCDNPEIPNIPYGIYESENPHLILEVTPSDGTRDVTYFKDGEEISCELTISYSGLVMISEETEVITEDTKVYFPDLCRLKTTYYILM